MWGRAGDEVWLSPTRLALALASGGASETGSVLEGFVVVETNYRVRV